MSGRWVDLWKESQVYILIFVCEDIEFCLSQVLANLFDSRFKIFQTSSCHSNRFYTSSYKDGLGTNQLIIIVLPLPQVLAPCEFRTCNICPLHFRLERVYTGHLMKIEWTCPPRSTLVPGIQYEVLQNTVPSNQQSDQRQQNQQPQALLCITSIAGVTSRNEQSMF